MIIFWIYALRWYFCHHRRRWITLSITNQVGQSNIRVYNLPKDLLQKKYSPSDLGTMKEILEERTNLCLSLALSSNRKQAVIDRALISARFGMLFKDAPSILKEVNWAIVEDRGTIYGFLATDEEFIPHCKLCNVTVYVSLRGRMGRIGCSNSLCKLKLLAEFEFS